jgi:HEPN domain-containing protein
LQNEDINAIISSSSPVTSHIIAKELKNKHKIPWVADLRDLWTQNHSYHYGNIRKFFELRLELKTLQQADALVTVSPLWAEQLRTLHRGKKTYTITNGFDPDKMSTGQVDLTSKFTITYTGLIYTGRHDLSKLLAALHNLISDGSMNPSDVEVRFYGPENELLAKEIEEYGVSTIAKYHGMVPQEIAFEKQRESQILLLLNWEVRWRDQREKGWYPQKVFEYLAAQRPILATGGFGDDVVKELLDEINAGAYAPTVEDIKSILRELYSEYKLKGKIDYGGDVEKINKYSHREMARKFAGILDSQIQQGQKADENKEEVL